MRREENQNTALLPGTKASVQQREFLSHSREKNGTHTCVYAYVRTAFLHERVRTRVPRWENEFAKARKAIWRTNEKYKLAISLTRSRCFISLPQNRNTESTTASLPGTCNKEADVVGHSD